MSKHPDFPKKIEGMSNEQYQETLKRYWKYKKHVRQLEKKEKKPYPYGQDYNNPKRGKFVRDPNYFPDQNYYGHRDPNYFPDQNYYGQDYNNFGGGRYNDARSIINAKYKEKKPSMPAFDPYYSGTKVGNV